MRPHSADLRRRIVTLYERGEGLIRQLAIASKSEMIPTVRIIKETLNHRSAREWRDLY